MFGRAIPPAMDPILKVIMEDEPVSTTPRQVFHQADELFQQAAALRKDADDLQERVKFMYERADTLTTTAEGLQEIALQDRDAMQERWNYGLRKGQEDLTIYVSEPDNATRFNEMQMRIEDGMVNAHDMGAFADGIEDFLDSRREERSTAPEPEIPALSEEPALLENLLKSQRAGSRDLKRKVPTNYEDGAGAIEYGIQYGIGKQIKRMKHDQQSYEVTLVNDEDARFKMDGPEEYTNDSEEATTEVDESSDEGSRSADEEGYDQRHVLAGATESSDENESSSSTSDNTHTTDEACGLLDDNPSLISDAQSSESGGSSVSNPTSASSSSADSVHTSVAQKAKGYPGISSKAMQEDKTMEVAPQNDRKSRTTGKRRITMAADQETPKLKIRPASFWRKQGYIWDEQRLQWWHPDRL
ncbi:hypothetical protein H2200_000922 [Cladophialophora chaetospira]|uniref:Uncharacterized protein n=1 Tax=Cladophialophora chaetospira TaxID=386627 RepID=A0AA39CRH4_9EURO|nr:hypothetical protein H2200_000922 [Cladophialophora chaetospira]